MSFKNIFGATFLSLILVFVVCGCKDTTEVAVAKSQSVRVVINIDKKDEVYNASMAYYCNGEHCGSPTVVNADSSVLSGDYSFEFTEADFPDGRIPEDFEFELFVSDSVAGSVSRSAGTIDLGRVEYGKVYEYKLHGDFVEGFGLKK